MRPAGALRIATAFVDDGSPQHLTYHAVLLVDTDRGTLVLDSRHRTPRPWQDLAYVWMTAQIPGSGGAWARLPAEPAAVRMAMAANGSGAGVYGH